MVEPARILFFGRLADVAGRREAVVALSGPTDIAAIIATLGEGAPELAAALAAPSVRVAVNKRVAPLRAGKAEPGDEIAFLPPVSGG